MPDIIELCDALQAKQCTEAIWRQIQIKYARAISELMVISTMISSIPQKIRFIRTSLSPSP